MKTKGFFTSFFLILLVVLGFSCSRISGPEVKSEAMNGFPVLKIKNPGGTDINIVPASTAKEGSIGYISGDSVTWLKGKPRVTLNSENECLYSWETDNGDSVTLSINQSGPDLTFSLAAKISEGEQPSGWLLNIKAGSDEYFTGIFERVTDGSQSNSWADGITEALDLRGQKVDVKIRPTVSAYAPFYISSANYGFFAEGTWPAAIDFCKEDNNLVKIMLEGPAPDFKIYTSDNLMDIVRRHALETGPSFMPPQWAFGPWRWRDDHSNKPAYYDGTLKKAPYNTDVVEDILMMQAFDIPLTAYWVDRPWATGPNGFDDYEWDTKRFPDPEGMIKWLNSRNVEFMIWIAPFVMGKMAEYAEQAGYNLESKMYDDNPGQVLIDFTNPDAVKWWGENGPGKLAKMGVRGFKLDRADGEKLLDSLNLITHDGRSYRENYNDFPRQYVKATFDAVKPVLGDNFILYPRAQYTGSAKYGGMWAGDTNGKPEGLRSAIIGLQRCAVMGYPIWASDIGGYWGSFSRETAMRWLAFGCFSPVMEVGPTNNKGFWDNPEEPHYDTELIAVWRLYSKIRMQIKDYAALQAQKAHDDGTPVVRPLFLAFPDQKEARNEWQTYMFGPDILVSAIWQSGITQQNVWLPAGETWIDAWSPEMKEYKGGTYINVTTPPYKIPLFIRKGSDLNLGNLENLYIESLKLASEKPDITSLESMEKWK